MLPFASRYSEVGQVEEEPATDYRRFSGHAKVVAVYRQESGGGQMVRMRVTWVENARQMNTSVY